MVPYLQPSGQAMGLKLWFQSDLLKLVERFELDTAPIQAECSNHYAMLPGYQGYWGICCHFRN